MRKINTNILKIWKNSSMNQTMVYKLWTIILSWAKIGPKSWWSTEIFFHLYWFCQIWDAGLLPLIFALFIKNELWKYWIKMQWTHLFGKPWIRWLQDLMIHFLWFISWLIPVSHMIWLIWHFFIWFITKVGCIFPMFVVSLLPHAEFGKSDHREDAPHFTLNRLICSVMAHRMTIFI